MATSQGIPLQRRATVKLKRPNPLFEKWLLEWQNEAAQLNSNRQYIFENALESLRKYPIVLNSGKECLVLEHFDTQLCVKLDRKLAEHRNNVIGNPIFKVAVLTATCDSVSVQQTSEITASPVTKKRKNERSSQKGSGRGAGGGSRGKRGYLPSYRSVPYALIITLHKAEQLPHYKGYMSKAEVQKEAQCLCNSSFSKAVPGTYFTAWSSMGKLVTKGLVKKEGNPAKFSLTSEGQELAMKLIELQSDKEVGVSGEKKAAAVGSVGVSSRLCVSSLLAPSKRGMGKAQQVTNDDSTEPEVEGEAVPEQEVFLPGSFQVLLLVDTAETSGSLRKEDDATVKELTTMGVNFEVRHLKVGDFLWVCRHRASSAELVLPYIVERKRLDDLSKSIKDGRFHEQKFRLKQCGLANLIYLVESNGRMRPGLPMSSLQQAVINTHVVDGFSVKMTSSHTDSMKYLAQLTAIFTDVFQNKTLLPCKKDQVELARFNIDVNLMSLLTFADFSRGIAKNKNFSVKEMFIKQLVQLHGMSAEKARAVSERYPTPLALAEAYEDSSCSESLLSDIQYGLVQRRIGPAISSALHSLYTLPVFPSS